MGASDNVLGMIETGMKNIDRNQTRQILKYIMLLNRYTPADNEENIIKQELISQLQDLQQQPTSSSFLSSRTNRGGRKRKSRKSRRNRRTKTKKNKSKSIFSFFM
uniref:Uncharacterized protein n=1 Tax=viral metagenome TaxID=1070528 RepID=A0A6C0LEV6_9ZZZZ